MKFTEVLVFHGSLINMKRENSSVDEDWERPEQSAVEKSLIFSLIQKSASTQSLMCSINLACSKMAELDQVLSDFALPNSSFQVENVVSTSSDLLGMLNRDNLPYAFELKLASKFPLGLSKKKAFNFNVRVKDHLHKLRENDSFRILIELYTSESPPQLISKSIKGKQIFESEQFSDIVRFQERKKCHMAFGRIRINEVSSHFPNCWVFLVARADPESPFLVLNDFCVKPLIIENVKVKSIRS